VFSRTNRAASLLKAKTFAYVSPSLNRLIARLCLANGPLLELSVYLLAYHVLRFNGATLPLISSNDRLLLNFSGREWSRQSFNE
jgi:hypothetical protein